MIYVSLYVIIIILVRCRFVIKSITLSVMATAFLLLSAELPVSKQDSRPQ